MLDLCFLEEVSKIYVDISTTMNLVMSLDSIELLFGGTTQTYQEWMKGLP